MPAVTLRPPRSFNIDPAGRYLLSVGQLSNSMTSYAIDKATGELTRFKEYPGGQESELGRDRQLRAVA
jgi:6-phosphogluconolactonase